MADFTVGGGIPEAPLDGVQYTRGDTDWSQSSDGAIISANLTLDGTEATTNFTLVSDSTRTLTLPLASTVAAGYLLNLKNQSDKRNTGWTVATQGSDTINGGSSFSIATGESYLVERVTSTTYLITNASVDVSSLVEVTSVSGDADILVFGVIDGIIQKITKANFLAATVDVGGFDANDVIFPSSSPAAASSRNGHPIIAFDDTIAENVLYNSSVPGNYNNQDINFDIDWVAESATTGGVTWGVEVERNAPGGTDIDSPSFAAQQTGTSTTNGTSGVITRTTITLTQAQADGVESLDLYRLRLQRVTSDGGDDMVGDAEILYVGIR